jgi:hypothetical protein
MADLFEAKAPGDGPTVDAQSLANGALLNPKMPAPVSQGLGFSIVRQLAVGAAIICLLALARPTQIPWEISHGVIDSIQSGPLGTCAKVGCNPSDKCNGVFLPFRGHFYTTATITVEVSAFRIVAPEPNQIPQVQERIPSQAMLKHMCYTYHQTSDVKGYTFG